MPRPRRSTEPGTVYHLISRFVDRDWFITSEAERRCYLGLFGRAVANSDWCALAYAVMSNHMHHVVVAGAQPLDRWLRRVHSPFADRLNLKHDRIGAIFVRGPKQRAVEVGRVADVIAYVHNNPVRAGLVQEARLSSWTSHRAYLGLDPTPTWLSVDAGLALAGFADPRGLDAFVRSPSAGPERDLLRERLLIEEPEARAPFHRPAVQVVDAAQVVAATARVLGMDPGSIRSRRRTRWHVFARHVAILAADRIGLSGVQIATALGLSQQAASSIVHRAVSGDVRAAAGRVVSDLECDQEVADQNW